MSNGTEIYLQAIQATHDKLANLLSTGEAKQLESELDDLRTSLPGDDDFVDEALDLLQDKYPDVYQELQTAVSRLQKGKPLEDAERNSHLPGLIVNIVPGTIMYCPNCDYEYELIDIGELPLFCPNDGKKLKPRSET